MIKITNGTDVKVVTKGMFDSLYSGMGYRPVVNKNESRVVKEETPKVSEEKKVEVKEVQKGHFNKKK